ncbi:quinone oxidoreductase-like protein, partial [Dinothrombium tinctorium]
MSTFKKLQVFDLSTDFAKAVRVVEATKPIPAADEVLVKNIYAGVNASDINVTAGRYFTFGEPPFDIGFEALGTIEAVGPEVILQPGQAVLLFGNQGFSEYLLCKQEKAIPIPELQPEYIALFVVGLTAAIGLDEDGIDVIWETIGGSVAEMLFSHLADKGRMILIGGISGYKDEGFPPFNVPDLPVK